METPWSTSANSVVREFDTDLESGLTDEDVKRRRDIHGENRLRETKTRGLLEILWDQLKSLIVLLLVVAAVVAFLYGELIEAGAIGVVVVINTAIGFFTEWRALRSMESLRELGGVEATVLRGGELRTVPAEDLVPGDVVKLTEGDLITSDVRLIESSNIQVDESALTGESVPVEKNTESVDDDAPLAERTSMAYKGTVVTRGEATGVVVETGMETELGEISELVEQAEAEQTPLEKRLGALGNKLIWLTLLVAGLVTISGIVAGRDLFLMVETGIALAVAAVPEGLPIVATMALARGMWRMADRNALINRLSAVETLGSTTQIFTDKTGTLTENRMTVRSVVTSDGDYRFDRDEPFDSESLPGDLKRVLEVISLCNNASFTETEDGDSKLVGDPMEAALLEASEDLGVKREELRNTYPEVREESFSTETRMMGTIHEHDEGYFVAVKGAPEAVLNGSDKILVDGETKQMTEEEKNGWLEANRRLASNGLRLLSVAFKTTNNPEEDPYENLIHLGLVGLLDPPRADVKGAIERCHEAGIKVTMVTGDMAETARNIAREVGLVETDDAEVREGKDLEDTESMDEDTKRRLLGTPIFSRVSPRQKLNLIDLHQEFGGVAGMTGDGVNDAPALKKADIGIAMGQRGTQVAREAADMVLLDDAFSTIVSAIEQGRVIFENIRKFVFYLLSCNVSEILVVGIASILATPLPILPLQILLLNLVTDVFPALALGMGEGERFIMEKPPRDPDEPILKQSHWIALALFGLVFTVAVLGSLFLALYGAGFAEKRAVTVSFLTLAFAQLWHVFNMRDYGSGILVNDITRNGYMWGALLLCVLILVGVVYVPFLASVLKVTAPGPMGWVIILSTSLIPLVYGQFVKEFDLHLFQRTD